MNITISEVMKLEKRDTLGIYRHSMPSAFPAK